MVTHQRTGRLSESERLLELLYQSIKSHGLNPADTFLLLAKMVLDGEFAETPSEDLEVKSRAFRSLVESDYPDGLGIKPAARLGAIIRDFRHPDEDPPRRSAGTAERMDRMRARVAQLLPGQAADRPGTYTRGIDSITNNAPRGNAAEVIRRLNRDDPDLARQIAEGKISANAAAIKAGYRPRRFTVRADSPESAAESLRRHMPAEHIAKLAALLRLQGGTDDT